MSAKALMRRILRAIEASGLLAVKLDDNAWLVPVPAKVTTVTMRNPDGFNPHEVRETVTMARCVILCFGAHKPPSILWKAVGANYWQVADDIDAIEALAEVGHDIRGAMEDGQ